MGRAAEGRVDASESDDDGESRLPNTLLGLALGVLPCHMTHDPQLHWQDFIPI